MFFGEIGEKKIDVRVRITNGKGEVVIKTGAFGSHDRTETSQEIDSTQFIGMVKIFTQLGFVAKIGERKTFNYILPDKVIASVVVAGPISYIELEKMSSEADLEENNYKLMKIANKLRLRLLNSEEEFDMLCKRLTENVDWPFLGTKDNFSRLEGLISHYEKP